MTVRMVRWWAVPLALALWVSSLPAQEAAALRGAEPPPHGIWLDSLDLSKMVQRRGTPRVGKSGAEIGRAHV